MARSIRKGQDDPMQTIYRRIHDLESDNQKREAEEVRIQPVDEASPRKNTPERAKQLATDHIATQSSNSASEVPAPTVARPESLENKRDFTPSRPTVTNRTSSAPAPKKEGSVVRKSRDPMETVYQRIHDLESNNERGSAFVSDFIDHYQH